MARQVGHPVVTDYIGPFLFSLSSWFLVLLKLAHLFLTVYLMLSLYTHWVDCCSGMGSVYFSDDVVS